MKLKMASIKCHLAAFNFDTAFHCFPPASTSIHLLMIFTTPVKATVSEIAGNSVGGPFK